MKVEVFKKWMIAGCLSFTFVSFSQDKDVHYEVNAEKKCRNEVSSVGCGTPIEGNQDSFFTCIDKKILKLSQECREMHKGFRDARKSNH